MNFRFTLNNSTEGTYVLTKTPVGWQDTELAVKRSDLFKGLFFDFTAKLKFFCGGGGKEYIDNIYDTYGVEAAVSILVEIDCSDSGIFDTLYEGVLNLSSYSKTQTAPEYTIVAIEQEGIEQTIINRYDATINLNKLETLDGTALTEFTYGDDNFDLNLHSKAIIFSSLLSMNNGDAEINVAAVGYGGAIDVALYYSVPINAIEFDDIPGADIPGQNTSVNIIGEPFVVFIDPVFQNISDVSTTYSLEVILNGYWSLTTTNPTPDNYALDLKYKIGTDYISAAETVILSYGTIVTPGSDVPGIVPLSISETRSIIVPPGQYLWVYMDATGLTIDEDKEDNARLHSDTGSVKVSETSIETATTCKAFGIFEAGARLAQAITNQTDAFRSDYFGRINAQPFAVEENGCASFTAITNGFQIRQFPIADSGTTPNLIQGRPIYTSLKDYFESLSAIHNLGLGVDNGQYIRIEPIEYFFDTEVLFQIPNIKNYKIRNAEEFYVSGIEVGYDKWETEEVNGLDEINTKREYSTLLKKTGTKISKLSKYIASPYALELTRRKPYTGQSTTDSKYDQENFIVCLNRSVNPYTGVPSALSTAEKNENYSDITNLISPATTYNFRITPGRIIRRWFKSIAPSLIKMNATLKNVKFAFGQGNYKATGTGSGTCDVGLSAEINEGSDLELLAPAVHTSLDPLWEPEFIEFEAPMTYSQYKLIKANPTKCLEISPYDSNFIKAFIYDVRYSPVKGKAKFILLKAYAQENDCSHLYVEAGYVECGYVE